jgi:hypothetical protein
MDSRLRGNDEMAFEENIDYIAHTELYDTADDLDSEDAMVTMRRNGAPQTISANVARHSRANAALRSGLQPCSKSGSS